jgi:two-component system, OmpR family, sensor kinase
MTLPVRARLALVSGVLVAALLAGMGAFLYLRLRGDLLATVEAGLRSRAEALLAAGLDDLPGSGGLIEPEEAFTQVLTADGRVLGSSAGLAQGPLLSPNAIAGLGQARFFDAEVHTAEEPVPARLLAVPASDGLVVVVGASLEDQDEALARLLALLALGGPVVVGLAFGVGWLLAGAALRPVERMRVEAEAISGSEPGRRLSVAPTRDELARLGDSLNRMLGRLEEAVDRERRFADDASHELRTPLTNLKAELELALRRERSPRALRGALGSAAEETERLIRLAEDLLVLARADRGRLPVRRQDLDIAGLVRETVDNFTGRASSLGVTLETSIGQGVWARVDAARVRQAVGNLIDNALRHTPTGGEVRVELARGDGAVAIEVADTGEGFVPSFLPQAFEPFSRADASRGRTDGGSGLGLAIVRAVAEAHGGSVEARNRATGGAVVVLRIPGGSPGHPNPDGADPPSS